MTENKISSNWTIPLVILLLVFWVIPIPVMVFSGGIPDNPDAGKIVAGIIYLIMIGVIVYLFIFLAEVKLVGDDIVFKKMFRAEKKYSFDKIGYPSSFRFKRLKFTTVKMKDNTGKYDKYLILNNNALLSGERKDAEEILIALRKRIH